MHTQPMLGTPVISEFVFANISKNKGSRAQSYIKCLYKHAHCGNFKLKIDYLRPSEAEIQQSHNIRT